MTFTKLMLQIIYHEIDIDIDRISNIHQKQSSIYLQFRLMHIMSIWNTKLINKSTFYINS